MRMQWFGPSWGSLLCQDESAKTRTPVGQKCLFCRNKIEDVERGLVIDADLPPVAEADTVMTLNGWDGRTPVHVNCFLAAVGMDSGPWISGGGPIKLQFTTKVEEG